MYCPLMGLDALALNQYGCVHFVIRPAWRRIGEATRFNVWALNA